MNRKLDKLIKNQIEAFNKIESSMPSFEKYIFPMVKIIWPNLMDQGDACHIMTRCYTCEEERKYYNQ